MQGRRKVLGVGSALFCQACACRMALAQYLPPSAPSRVSSHTAVAPACGFNKNNPADTSAVKLFSESGNAELDRHMPVERRVLNDLFWVEPEFGYYDDGKSPNAISIRDGERVRIGLGLALLRGEVSRRPEGWQSAIIGVLAHEWAHAYQYSTRIVEQRHLWETHADYLSGWYFGNKLSMGRLQLDINVFADSLFRMGGNSGFFDPNDYGKPSTRVAAMLAGCSLGRSSFRPGRRPDFLDAVEQGYVFAANASR